MIVPRANQANWYCSKTKCCLIIFEFILVSWMLEPNVRECVCVCRETKKCPSAKFYAQNGPWRLFFFASPKFFQTKINKDAITNSFTPDSFHTLKCYSVWIRIDTFNVRKRSSIASVSRNTLTAYMIYDSWGQMIPFLCSISIPIMDMI